MGVLRILVVSVVVVAVGSAPDASAAPAAQRPVKCGGVTLKSPTVRLGKVVAVSRRGKATCRQAQKVVREFFVQRPKGLVRRLSIRGWKCGGKPGLLTCVRGRGRALERLLAKWTARAGAPAGGAPGGAGGGLGDDETVSDPGAGAYYDGPGRWYSDTIPYYDATANLQAGVEKAAQAWNASGARIRWVAVRREDARVVITESEELDVLGIGTMPLQGQRIDQGEIKLSPRLADHRNFGSSPSVGTQVQINVAVHEMGHVMGLDHQDGVCATMNTTVWESCNLESVPEGQYRCRAPEPPDVARLVEIYGGTATQPGPEFCPAAVAPPPPPPPGATDVAVTETPDPSQLRIAWTTPADPKVRGLRVLYKRDACPTSVDDQEASYFGDALYYIPAEPGRQSFEFGIGSGRYCFAVYTLGDEGQPGPAATVFYEYAAP